MPTTARTPIKKVIKIVFKIVINSSLLNSMNESSDSGGAGELLSSC